MSDLKLIDELLTFEALSMPQTMYADRIAALEQKSHLHREAFARLRQAWDSGEMPYLTAGLAEHFRRMPAAPPLTPESEPPVPQENP